MAKPTKKVISSALAEIGRLGGQSGKGKSKVRGTPEQRKLWGQQGAAKRWAKKRTKEGKK